MTLTSIAMLLDRFAQTNPATSAQGHETLKCNEIMITVNMHLCLTSFIFYLRKSNHTSFKFMLSIFG